MKHFVPGGMTKAEYADILSNSCVTNELQQYFSKEETDFRKLRSTIIIILATGVEGRKNY